MPVYYPSGCDTIVPDHYCDPCEDRELARVRSVAFIKNTFEFTDPTSPTEWQNGFASGDIILIPQTQGTFDGGAENEIAGYGDQDTAISGYKFTAEYRDPNYSNNCEFYNLLKNSREYRFAYRTSTKTHIANTTCQVIPKNPVENDITAEVVYVVTVKWADKDIPCPFDTPPGIFDTCVVAL